MFPNPYREKREQSQGEKEVLAGEYLLILFRFLRITMPFQSDVQAVKRVGVLLQRKYPMLIRIIDYYGRLIQKPSFWRAK